VYLTILSLSCVSACRVLASQAAGRWVPEAPYEMRGDTKALGGPRKGREAKERGERIEDLPFAGISVCLYGDFKSPSRSELQGLVELGGGKILLLLRLMDFADWRPCCGQSVCCWTVPRSNNEDGVSCYTVCCDSPCAGRLTTDPASSQGATVVVVVEKANECTGMSMFNPVKSAWVLDSVSNFRALLPPPESYLTIRRGPPAAAGSSKKRKGEYVQ
jgi:hypothetical protein